MKNQKELELNNLSIGKTKDRYIEYKPKTNDFSASNLVMKFHLINDEWKPSVDLDEWEVLDQDWVLEYY